MRLFCGLCFIGGVFGAVDRSCDAAFIMTVPHLVGGNLCALYTCISIPSFGARSFELSSVSELLLTEQPGCSFCCLLKNALLTSSDQSASLEDC